MTSRGSIPQSSPNGSHPVILFANMVPAILRKTWRAGFCVTSLRISISINVFTNNTPDPIELAETVGRLGNG
jgi:hypothetical protein